MSALPSCIATYMLEEEPALCQRLLRAFGSSQESVAAIEARCREEIPEFRTILWEGDPETFQFSYVSLSAADILGYPVDRWLREPTFWTDIIVHPDDRIEAVTFCALATAQSRNHDFRYRARTADGRIVSLLDVVQVITGGRGVPVKLRGLMLELPPGSELASRSARPLIAAND